MPLVVKIITKSTPLFPKKTLLALALLCGALLSWGLNNKAITELLDFLGLITPILFTAFGIWIGVIDPSKILFNKQKNDTALTQEDNTVYKLCYFLMYCTFILIAIIILKFFIIAATSWHTTLLSIGYYFPHWLTLILKMVCVTLISFLYLSILWLSFAILFPLLKTIDNFEKMEAEKSHFN